jgi:K+-transporting ATPase ATPase C chain
MTSREQVEPPDTVEPSSLHRLLRETRAALAITLILAGLAGVVFPAAVIGVGQVAFEERADGSLLRDEQGNVIGSKLIGQRFSGEQYFHPRPSAAGADGYDGSASSGLNLGPTNEQLLATIDERARAYRDENGVADHVELPADAVTTSASGLDPHISPANAVLQVARVARARGMSEDEVRDLVDEHTDDPALGFFGEPWVNVLLLNRALDEAQR